MTKLIQDIIGTESWAACNTQQEKLNLIKHVVKQHVNKRVQEKCPGVVLLDDFERGTPDWQGRWFYVHPDGKLSYEVLEYWEDTLLESVDDIERAIAGIHSAFGVTL